MTRGRAGALRLAAGLCLVALAGVGCGRRAAVERGTPADAAAHAAAGVDTADRGLAHARAFYAAQPRFLSPVPWSPLPEGLPNLRAETCGVCHVDIYEEWKLSAHAQAWLGDPQFLEELKNTTATPGRDASWICMNCHTPLQQQLPRLVTALEGGNRGKPIYVANAEFDPTLQKEAITCATCHVRDGFVLGPYGDTHAPHAVKKSDDLRSSALCTQCHEANEELDDVSLACVFDTGRSFAAGPAAAEGKTCQDCHMPPVQRPPSRFLPTGDVERFILVTARVTDATGAVVAERTERFGARFEWEPTVRKLEDTRLAPRETRTFTLKFRAPARGPLLLHLEGVHWRMNEENFAYHQLEGRSVRGRTFFTAVDPVRVR